MTKQIGLANKKHKRVIYQKGALSADGELVWSSISEPLGLSGNDQLSHFFMRFFYPGQKQWKSA